MFLVLLGLVTLLLTACGGGSHSSGPTSNAPVLANLRMTQTRTSTGGAIQFMADVFDPNGDIAGGQCVIQTTNFGTTTRGLPPRPGTSASTTTGTVFCGAPYQGRGVTVLGEFYVFDQAGNESNHLPFTFVAEDRRE